MQHKAGQGEYTRKVTERDPSDASVLRGRAFPRTSRRARPTHGEFAALVLHEKPMSPAGAADDLGVSRATVYTLCARGEIPHLRVGSSLRLLLTDVVASLARRGS
jgi:excisionase family DNA binding protein